MPAGSWSNPYQDPHTAAAVAPDALHFADIGPIVAHIMQMRENQARAKDQANKEMIAGVGNAVVGAKEGYDKYEKHNEADALANYKRDYLMTGQDNMDELGGMSPTTQAMALEWKKQQEDTSKFITDPQTGQRFYKTSHGVAPMAGAGGAANSGYSFEYDENGQLWKTNNKTGNRTAVANDPKTKEHQEAMKAIKQDVGYSGLDEEKFTSMDPHANAQYVDKDGNPVSTEQAMKDPDNTKVIMPNGAELPFKYKDKYLSDVARAQKAKEAVKAGPVNFPGSGHAFGGGGINSQAAKIKAAYQAGQLSREDAKAQLQELGMQ